MEIRLLRVTEQRRFFADALNKARATIGFTEKPGSCLGRIHLQFGDLYGVFDNTTNPDRMLAGFALHPLDRFAQSYPKPDLTHLPAHTVFEVGELWSFSPRAAVIARWGYGLVAGMRQAHALLIYPIINPWDLTRLYPRFETVGTPIRWPFAQTLDGGGVCVQPMVAQRGGLDALITMVSQGGFEAVDACSRIQFPDPIRRAMSIRAAMRRERSTPPVSQRGNTQVKSLPG